MAIHRLMSFITLKQAGSYCGISQHWQITDPLVIDPYGLAKDLVDSLELPSGGDPYFDFLLPLLAEDTFVKVVRARVISPPNANTAVKFYQDAEMVGTFIGVTDALNVAGCIIFLSGADAGLTGRQFIPGVSEGAYEDGRAVTAYVDAINDYVTNLLLGVVGSSGTFFPVIKHSDPAAYALITNGYLSSTPGTQKRRRVPW